MEQQNMMEILNRPGMARARALIKAVGYDSEDLRRPGPAWPSSWSRESWDR